MAFRFESLAVWRRARAFSKQVYNVTRRFPADQRFGLAVQLDRAAAAVALLIAEGAGLETKALFRHRLALAVGEVSEVVGGAYLALDRGYIDRATHRQVYAAADSLAKQLNAFRRRLSNHDEAP